MPFIARSDQQLDRAAEARRLVEERYLDSASALFPDLAHAWDAQRQATHELREMADRLAEMDGVEVTLDDVASTDVGERLADLVEVAKVQALEKLGEEDRAVPIALDWLRTKRDARLAEAESALTL